MNNEYMANEFTSNPRRKTRVISTPGTNRELRRFYERKARQAEAVLHDATVTGIVRHPAVTGLIVLKP